MYRLLLPETLISDLRLPVTITREEERTTMPDNCSWYDTNDDLWYEKAKHQSQKKLKMEAKHKKQTCPVRSPQPDEFDLMPILTSGLKRAFDEG
ncbi:MAG: hypothetical protein IIC55_08625, partial [Proteobacteria bacterium]|nr:hypothetical protein [Pseudomonadota bacterium]